MSEYFDLMEYIDEEIEESRGGGSFVCQFSLGAGYLVYATGERAGRYFEVSPDTDREEQKKAAQELAKKAGKRANFVVTLYMYADSVLNRDETPNWKQAGPGVWAHDIAVWSDAYKEVLSTSIKMNLGEEPEFYKKYWGHILLVPDPYNEKSGKDNRVPQIGQVFESREEAERAVEDAGQSVAPKLPEKPENFNEDVLGKWEIYVGDVLKALSNGEDPEYFLVAPMGFGKAELEKVKEYYSETSIPF